LQFLALIHTVSIVCKIEITFNNRLVIIILTSIGLTSKTNAEKVNLGLDLQGGFEVLYQVEPLKEGQTIDEAAVKATADTISRRINILGVSEPVITVESGNRIRVELAGVKDQESARKVLSTQANLTIRDIDDKADNGFFRRFFYFKRKLFIQEIT